MRLNVLGNGFDLYHGLPSKYKHFAYYLVENYYEFYEELFDFYDIGTKRMADNGPTHEYKFEFNCDFWWCFEEELGKLDEYALIGKYSTDLGDYVDPIEIEVTESYIAEKLKQYFSEWVINQLDTLTNYNYICKNIHSSCISMNTDDLFLTFNYTHILQNVYGVSSSNIHYVHGEAIQGNPEDIVVGHANVNKINELKERIKEIRFENIYTQVEQNEMQELEAILKSYETTLKSVNIYLPNCSDFLKNKKITIDEICIYGHSLANIDLPYFRMIFYKYPNAKWKLSYFDTIDLANKMEILTNQVGIIQRNIESFHFNNAKSICICEYIVNSYDYEWDLIFDTNNIS